MDHPHAHPAQMHTSYVADDEPTIATTNNDTFTFTEAHRLQEKNTPKRENGRK